VNSRTALSHTLGLDAGELSDYQYQPGVFPRAIYGIGDSWYCLGKRPPNPVRMEHLAGLRWEPHADQFWASQAGTVIWRAEAQPAP
jgi:hypothetical protein